MFTTVHELFQTQPISNIRAIAKKTREDCEDKQLQLKHILSQNYNDLIMVADGIIDLKKMTENLSEETRKVTSKQPVTLNSTKDPKEVRNVTVRYIMQSRERISLMIAKGQVYDAVLTLKKVQKDANSLASFENEYPFLKSFLEGIMTSSYAESMEKAKEMVSTRYDSLKDDAIARIFAAILILNPDWDFDGLISWFLENRMVLLVNSVNTEQIFYSYQSTLLFCQIIYQNMILRLVEASSVDPILEALYSVSKVRKTSIDSLRIISNLKIPSEEKIIQWSQDAQEKMISKLESFLIQCTRSKDIVEIQDICSKQTKFYELEYPYISFGVGEVFPKKNLFETFYNTIKTKKKEFIQTEFSKIHFPYKYEQEDSKIGFTLWESAIVTTDQLYSRYKQRNISEHSDPYSVYQFGGNKDNIHITTSISGNTTQVLKVINTFFDQISNLISDLSTLVIKDRMSKKDDSEKTIQSCIYKLADDIYGLLDAKIDTVSIDEKLFVGRLCIVKKLLGDILADLNFGIRKKHDFQVKFDQIYKKTHLEWIQNLCKKSGTQIKKSFESQIGNIRDKMDDWEDVEVLLEEEKEMVKIPCKTSAYIEEVFFEISSQIYHLGGYTVDATITALVATSLANELKQVYEGTIENMTLKEEVILQLLFDVLYMGEVFFGKTYQGLQKQPNGDEKSHLQWIDLLIERIDPINYQIYEKALHANVSNYVKNTNLIYSFSQVKKNRTDEKAELSKNYLKIAPIAQPFPLLPIPIEKKEMNLTSPRTLNEKDKGSGMFGSFMSFFKRE